MTNNQTYGISPPPRSPSPAPFSVFLSLIMYMEAAYEFQIPSNSAPCRLVHGLDRLENLLYYFCYVAGPFTSLE